MPRKENGVFICYAHEDRYIAPPLFERLHSASVNVWIDEEKLEGGSEYKQRIRHAINNCKVFMPILSSQFKYDMTSDKQSERWYYKKSGCGHRADTMKKRTLALMVKSYSK